MPSPPPGCVSAVWWGLVISTPQLPRVESEHPGYKRCCWSLAGVWRSTVLQSTCGLCPATWNLFHQPPPPPRLRGPSYLGRCWVDTLCRYSSRYSAPACEDTDRAAHRTSHFTMTGFKDLYYKNKARSGLMILADKLLNTVFECPFSIVSCEISRSPAGSSSEDAPPRLARRRGHWPPSGLSSD